jgi:hypothetical protein
MAYKPRVRSYEDAKSLFKKARFPKRGKPLENNTRLHKRGEDYAVRLYSTDVVTYHPDGSVTVRTGGWETVTTADRIGRYSPISLRFRSGTAYFVGPDQAIEAHKVGGEIYVDEEGHIQVEEEKEHQLLMA